MARSRLASAQSASTIILARPLKLTLRLPLQHLHRLGRVAQQQVHLGGAEVSRVDRDVLVPVQAQQAEHLVEELADAVGLAGGDDVVVGLVLLEHQPHRLDVVAGEAPVALGVQVAQEQLVLQALLDAGGGAGDLAGDERLAAARALVVEQDAVAGDTSRTLRGS